MKTQRCDAASWLTQELRREPRLQRRLLERGRRAGFQVSELRAAAERLDVVIIGNGERLAFWALRAKP